jgi:hypothetical protein
MSENKQEVPGDVYLPEGWYTIPQLEALLNANRKMNEALRDMVDRCTNDINNRDRATKQGVI